MKDFVADPVAQSKGNSSATPVRVNVFFAVVEFDQAGDHTSDGSLLEFFNDLFKGGQAKWRIIVFLFVRQGSEPPELGIWK